MQNINHAAVWASAILLTVLGFVWYGPLFGEPWMAMVDLDMATVEANPPGTEIWITNIIATIVPLYVLAWLFIKLNVKTALDGLKYALIITFSFHFLSVMTSNLFAMQDYWLTWITGGYSLVASAISGLIIGGWQKKSN